MKKILAMMISAAALGAFAEYSKLVDGDYTYDYFYTAESEEVSLDSIEPLLGGSELDLAAVQKRFSEDGLKIVGLSRYVANLVSNVDEVTSVVLPEYFNADRVKDLRNELVNLESFTGGGTLLTVDGLVYADNGRTFVACPKAWSGSVTLRSDCRDILSEAFYGCWKLTGVSGGQEVLRVKQDAFGNLREPDGDGLPLFIEDMPAGVVTVCGVVLGWKGGKDSVPATVTLPDDATSVAEDAFTVKVKGVEGGSGIRWVGRGAFPDLIKSSPAGELVMIGRVLMGCNGDITELTPPADTLAIAPCAFQKKTALTTLNLSGLDMLETIGEWAFSECDVLESVTLPDCVKEVEWHAFDKCTGLLDFTFGKSIETLGDGVFDKCGNLKAVNFRCERAPALETPGTFYSQAGGNLVTHVRPDSTGWVLDDDGKWCLRAFAQDLKRDAVTGYVGYYGKWTLARLGVAVPPAGTVYSAVAYGLPKGLALKSNAAKKKGKKVITPAKTSWWIEGVPETTLDRDLQTAFVKTIVNGATSLQPLDLEVQETAVSDYDFNLNEPVVKKPGEFGLEAGWVVSGLPNGLVQVTKAKKVKVGGKSRTVPAYGVYGAPTESGNYVVSARKKKGSWYEVRRYRYRVLKEDGYPVEDPVIVKPIIAMDFNDYDGTKILTVQGGLRENGGEAVIHTFTASAGSKLVLTGAPSTLKLVETSEGSGTWNLVGYALPGDYHIGVTATQDGFEDTLQTLILHSDALPAWATGSFSGFVTGVNYALPLLGPVTPLNYATATVSEKGVISGKFVSDGETYIFKADSYTGLDGGAYTAAVPLQIYVSIVSYDKKKKKYVKVKTLVDSSYKISLKVSDGVNGGMLTADVTDMADDPVLGLSAPQNLWASSYKAIGKKLFYTSAKQQFKTFKVAGGYGLEKGASLTFKISPSGAVTVTGAFPYETVAKGRRVTKYRKPTASTVLIPETAPAVGAAGFHGHVAVCLGDYYRGIVDFPFAKTGDSWYTGEFNGMARVCIPYETTETSPNGTYSFFAYEWTHGTFNIKVSPRVIGKTASDYCPFTGTFTPCGKVSEAVAFSGTLKYVEEEVQAIGGKVEYFAGTSTITWKGWHIPISINISNSGYFAAPYDVGGMIEIRPMGSSCAQFRNDPPDFSQNIWLRSDLRETVLPECLTVPGGTVVDIPASVDYPGKVTGDNLVFKPIGNGRLAVSGTICGKPVDTTATLQVSMVEDSSVGCFAYLNFGEHGIFKQLFTFDLASGLLEADAVGTSYVDGAASTEY